MSAVAFSSRAARPRPRALPLWWSAIRPKTLPASLAPVVVGSALAYRDGALSLAVFFAAAIATLCFQIGTNLHNDGADFERGADDHRRLGPARAVAQGWLDSATVRKVAYASFAAAFLPGIYLVSVGGWPIVWVGVASVAAGLAYTGGPAPLAYNGLGDVFVFVFFGVVAVVGTYYLHTDAVGLTSLLIGCAVGCLTTAILVVNNLRDRHTDRDAGKMTTAVRFGATFARVEYAGLLAAAYVFVLAAGHLENDTGFLYPLASAPVALLLIRSVSRVDGAALNPLLGRTAALTLLFSLLVAIGGIA